MAAPCLRCDFSANDDRAPVAMTDALSNDVLPAQTCRDCEMPSYCASRS
jgi:hypothetical protein